MPKSFLISGTGDKPCPTVIEFNINSTPAQRTGHYQKEESSRTTSASRALVTNGLGARKGREDEYVNVCDVDESTADAHRILRAGEFEGVQRSEKNTIDNFGMSCRAKCKSFSVGRLLSCGDIKCDPNENTSRVNAATILPKATLSDTADQSQSEDEIRSPSGSIDGVVPKIKRTFRQEENPAEFICDIEDNECWRLIKKLRYFKPLIPKAQIKVHKDVKQMSETKFSHGEHVKSIGLLNDAAAYTIKMFQRREVDSISYTEQSQLQLQLTQTHADRQGSRDLDEGSRVYVEDVQRYYQHRQHQQQQHHQQLVYMHRLQQMSEMARYESTPELSLQTRIAEHTTSSLINNKTSQNSDDAVERYSCNTCSKSYATFGGVTKHRQLHCSVDRNRSLKREYRCDRCPKSYSTVGALKMHVRTHTLPCRCTVCGKAFSRPWLLQGHMRTHTGEKPFSCEHCQRAFADRSNLRAHLQTHSAVKRYRCTSCQKTFSRMSLLLKHQQTSCPNNLVDKTQQINS